MALAVTNFMVGNLLNKASCTEELRSTGCKDSLRKQIVSYELRNLLLKLQNGTISETLKAKLEVQQANNRSSTAYGNNKLLKWRLLYRKVRKTHNDSKPLNSV